MDTGRENKALTKRREKMEKMGFRKDGKQKKNNRKLHLK